MALSFNATDALGIALADPAATTEIIAALNTVSASPGTFTNVAVTGSITHTGSLVGFFSATPAAQPSGAGQAALTDSTGGTASTTLADVTATPTQTLINSNFASLARQTNALRSALVALGLIKGSA